MSQFTPLLTDLRNRKLWPLAAALLAALVAIPVLLSQSPAPAPVPPAPSLGAMPIASAATGPAVTVNSDPQQAKLTGHGRDPFLQQLSAAVTGAAASVHAAPALSTGSPSVGASAGTSGSSGASAAGGSSAGSASGSTGASPAGSGASPSPPSSGGGGTAGPQPSAHSGTTQFVGLRPTQSYGVALAVTDPNGNLNTIGSLERLSVLPSAQQPWLVNLGVLQGGGSVLFAVQPGTVPSGPGRCLPGPLDCEILSLNPGQNETIQSGGNDPVTFQVTDVSRVSHGSAGDAQQARGTASPAGRRLIAASTASALALFPYVPSLGAVVDERNLTVGGN